MQSFPYVIIIFMAERAPKIDAIYICSDAGLPMESRSEVQAIEGLGLEGDRYASGIGAFSKGKKEKIRHVSLIESEAIEGTGFSAEQTRRNLITTNIDLNALVGQEFQVGSVRMKGTELCKPCVRPSILSGREGFKDTFDNKGGLRAEILSDGDIKVDDQIHIFSKDLNVKK